jgi:uncharacterized protein with PIN domain
MTRKKASFRFYEELNDFLPPERKKVTFTHTFTGNPAIKDIIESLGVPHVEVDLILVNDKSVGFDYQLQTGDQISVYPQFESIDITSITKLRSKPLRVTKFILDVHLGKLAHYLRLLGFDTLYDNKFHDPEIITIAQKEKRIILTRDIALLKNKIVTHGYWIRNIQPRKQIEEVLDRFDLRNQLQPFTRCLECNGKIIAINKNEIENLPANTDKYYEDFSRCLQCKKIYWPGSHYLKLKKFVGSL